MRGVYKHDRYRARKNIYGNDWAQKTGRAIFPILIQMAIDPQKPDITYGALADKAEEAGIEFKAKSSGYRARPMRYPLGCILRTLFEYHEESGMDIPYLTIIVVNKKSGLPTHFSEGQGWSIEKIQAKQKAVYEYEHWEHIRQAILQD